MSFVYLIASKINGAICPPVKIGITRDLPARLRSLQTASPHPLIFYQAWDLSSFDGQKAAAYIEKSFAFAWKKYRLSGEWYMARPVDAESVITREVRIYLGIINRELYDEIFCIVGRQVDHLGRQVAR